MENSINSFIKQTENGLYLIDMPTGTGKTFKSIEYMFNNVNNFKKIIYITSLNKNVDDAYEDLKKRFNDQGMIEFFENNVLRIKSNGDMVIEKLSEIAIDSEDKIMSFNSFKQLKKQVDGLHQSKNIDSFLKDTLIKEIKEKLEPSFRKDVRVYLNSQGKNKKERKKIIDKFHPWLKELYPAILTSYRKIIFTTVDKFYLGNDPLIEPAYKFVDNAEIMKNSLIFIDEIDATKNTILNREIEESLNNKVDFIHLFLDIRNTLNSKKFPKVMLKASKKDVENKRLPREILIKMKDVFNKVFENNRMEYAFKIEEKDNDRKYIFDDNSLITVNDSKDNKLYISVSSEENYNKITSINNEGLKLLNDIIHDVNGALSYFINGCGMLSFNYLAYYNENKKDTDDVMQIDDAVSSIVRAFNISERYIKFVCNSVLSRGISKYKNKSSINTDVYETGFRYFEFNDSLDNSLSTIISMYDLNDSPESFLLKLCEKSHVIGLSATSTMDTVIGNYDLQYLKDNLGDKFYIPNETEEKEVTDYISERINSNKSKISVESIGVSDPNIDINNLLTDERNAEKIVNLEDKLNRIFDSNRKYYFSRFLKVCFAIKSFMLSNLNSLLILCNRNFKQNDIYSKEVFELVIQMIKAENNLKSEYKIVNLVSRDFEESRIEYQKYLRENKKVIIFSSYPTTGAGQNLQYEFYEDNKKLKEDLNAIYIEKPTNIIVNTTNFNETTAADLIKYIFQVEALKASGEISQKSKMICIKEGFLKLYNNKSKRNHDNLYETNSVKNQAISIIIQAVGRICRTHNKINDTNIYVDEEIFNLDLESIRNRRLNKEFIAIIDKAKDINEDNKNIKNKSPFKLNIQKGCNRNRDLALFINNLVYFSNWNKDTIKLWKDLREFVLCHPTFNGDFGNDGRFSKCYLYLPDFPLNSYYYTYDNDFLDVNITTKKYDDKQLILCSEETNLDVMMSIPKIKEYFIEHGYATEFIKENHIMLPVIYNNIYKGALGEAVGKCIIEQMNFELEEITDESKFEKFDYCYKNIYIDFKNWNNKGEKLDIKHVVKKYEEVKAEKIMVINIVGNINERITELDNLIVIPALIDKESHKLSSKAYKKIWEVLINAK